MWIENNLLAKFFEKLKKGTSEMHSKEKLTGLKKVLAALSRPRNN